MATSINEKSNKSTGSSKNSTVQCEDYQLVTAQVADLTPMNYSRRTILVTPRLSGMLRAFRPMRKSMRLRSVQSVRSNSEVLMIVDSKPKEGDPELLQNQAARELYEKLKLVGSLKVANTTYELSEYAGKTFYSAGPRPNSFEARLTTIWITREYHLNMPRLMLT